MKAAYSIKDLEVLTGIKAHTIRIWEKRYGIMEPQRTDTNIRLYTDPDLKNLLNISLLNRHGLKISKIACMDQQEISERIMQYTDDHVIDDSQIDKLIVAMIDLDEIMFNDVLSRSITSNGFEDTLVNVLYPFFTRIGILWQINAINPAQEHFVSNIVRQKLFAAINELEVNTDKDRKRFILFLPEGELHELGLLFKYYLIKNQGYEVMYLGQTLPFSDLIKVCDIRKPHYILTSVTAPMPDDGLVTFVNQLSKQFPDTKIFISGPQILESKFPISRNIVKISSVADFKGKLAKLS